MNEPVEAAPAAPLIAEPSALSQRALDEIADRVYRLLAEDLARQRERRGGRERWR